MPSYLFYLRFECKISKIFLTLSNKPNYLPMTKLFIFFVILFLSACSEPETIEPTTPDIEQEADLQDVEVKIDNNYSRAAAVASNTLQIFWSKGDKITLTDLEQQSDYTLSSGQGVAMHALAEISRAIARIFTPYIPLRV